METKLSRISTRRVRKNQKYRLLQLMQQHRSIGKGQYNTPDERKEIKQVWAAVARELNAMGGSYKTAEQWRRCWVDWKSSVKKQHNALRIRARQTGNNSQETGVPNLVGLDSELVQFFSDDKEPNAESLMLSIVEPAEEVNLIELAKEARLSTESQHEELSDDKYIDIKTEADEIWMEEARLSTENQNEELNNNSHINIKIEENGSTAQILVEESALSNEESSGDYYIKHKAQADGFTSSRISTGRLRKTQKYRLLQLMKQHHSVGKGEFRTPKARMENEEVWITVARELNAMGGSYKSSDQWRRCWIDWKASVKKQHNAYCAFVRHSGNNLSEEGGPQPVDGMDSEIVEFFSSDLEQTSQSGASLQAQPFEGVDVTEFTSDKISEILPDSPRHRFTGQPLIDEPYLSAESKHEEITNTGAKRISFFESWMDKAHLATESQHENSTKTNHSTVSRITTGRVRKNQKRRLLQLMQQHRKFGKGHLRTQKEVWVVIARELNALGGSVKTAAQWRRCWIDLKSKFKRQNKIHQPRVSPPPPQPLWKIDSENPKYSSSDKEPSIAFGTLPKVQLLEEVDAMEFTPGKGFNTHSKSTLNRSSHQSEIGEARLLSEGQQEELKDLLERQHKEHLNALGKIQETMEAILETIKRIHK